MARVISVFLPTWPTDRLRRQAGDTSPPDDAPLVVAGRVGTRRLITGVDASAAALGLTVGMAVSKAQAMVPGLRRTGPFWRMRVTRRPSSRRCPLRACACRPSLPPGCAIWDLQPSAVFWASLVTP